MRLTKKYVAIIFIVFAFLFLRIPSTFASTLYSNTFNNIDFSDWTQMYGNSFCDDSSGSLVTDASHNCGLEYNSSFSNLVCVSADIDTTDTSFDALRFHGGQGGSYLSAWDISFQPDDGTRNMTITVGPGSGSDTASMSTPTGVHNYALCRAGNTYMGYLDGSQVVSVSYSGTVGTGFALLINGGSDQASNAVNNFLATDTLPTAPTPTPTPTATPTPAPNTIAVAPSSSTVTVGTPFNATIAVNSGQAFNAAQAHVAVSSNLTVTGIHAAPAPQCNFQYTQTPTSSDPSFAGAIFGSSSTNCNVYTLTLTPNATGVGTITLTNGAMKAYADSSEILSDVANGSFTINAATPTPTPVGASTLTLDDSVHGSGANQWNYVGSNWSHCANCNDTATFYNSSVSWDNTADEYVTLTFTGTQIKLYGFTDPRDGIGAVSLDNGTETNVDFYSATRTGDVLLWTSPTLPNTQHTLKLRVTGTHDSNATDSYIGPDRADVLQGATNTSGITFNTYPLDTYASTFTLSGGKDASTTSIFVNGSADNSTYPTDTSWENPLNLVLGTNTFIVYGTDSANNQTASQSVQINRHTLGDINGDGAIDLTDASLFAVDYGKTSDLTYALSDMNGDGSVDLTDLSILAKLESE